MTDKTKPILIGRLDHDGREIAVGDVLENVSTGARAFVNRYQCLQLKNSGVVLRRVLWKEWTIIDNPDDNKYTDKNSMTSDPVVPVPNFIKNNTGGFKTVSRFSYAMATPKKGALLTVSRKHIHLHAETLELLGPDFSGKVGFLKNDTTPPTWAITASDDESAFHVSRNRIICLPLCREILDGLGKDSAHFSVKKDDKTGLLILTPIED